MLELDRHTNHITVHYEGKELGQISLSHNPYHQRRTYLTLELCTFPLDMAELLFQSLLQESELSFQVMLPSDDQEKIAFLTAGGFRCRRRCFDVDLTKNSYLGPKQTPEFQIAKRGQANFDTCANLMFAHYQTTHQPINPWTASQETFYQLLPDTVYFTSTQQQINNLAFIEGNEIAYMTGQAIETFQVFMTQVIGYLLSQYEQISFEADDCDPFAMTLLDFCQTPPQDSWDTYLLDKIT